MMHPVRTTITLTPEADGLVRRVMRERGLSFKDAVNTAIIEGFRPPEVTPYSTPVFDLGVARIPGHKALQLAAELEDEEIVRRLERGR